MRQSSLNGHSRPGRRAASEPTPADADVVLDVLVPAWLEYPDPGSVLLALAPWLEKKPDDARLRTWQGDALVLARDLPAAKAAYTAAGEPAKYKLAEVLRQLGEHAAAKEHFSALLTQKPTHPEYRLGAARCERLLGELPAATAKLDELIRENPTDARALAERAAIDIANKNDVAAVAKLQKAAELEAFPELAEWLAAVHGRNGPAEQAKNWQERADAAKQGQKDADAAAKLVRDNPRDADARVKLASACLSLGEINAALTWLRSAIAEDPRHPQAGPMLKELTDRKYVRR
jgi:tetratricopeptide (TPR) repeat protein